MAISVSRALDLLTGKYTIVTTNTAILNPTKVRIFGTDMVNMSSGKGNNLDSKEQELNNVTVNAKKTLKDIIAISANGFSLSITPKSDIPKLMDALEDIIECFYKNLGTNSLARSTKIPGTDIVFSTVVDFYTNLADNNKEEVNRLIIKDIEKVDDGFVVLGESNPLGSYSSNIKTGSRFILEAKGANDGSNNLSDAKQNFKGLRDGY